MGAAEVGVGFWTVSDLHLGHRLVSELRGFASTEQHDEVILNNLREIPDGATLVCLGDISVRRDDEALRRLGELKREKSLRMILVPGNPDRVHPMCGMESVVEWTYEVQGSLRCDHVESAGADWSVACVADSYSAGCGEVCGGGSALVGQACSAGSTRRV